MSAKHTPGPWTNQVVNTVSGVCFKVGPFPWKEGELNHACIYADYPNKSGYEQCAANARLIAAAPDLLEELREVEKHLQSYVDAIEYGGGAASKSSERLASVRAAIAKATGDAA